MTNDLQQTEDPKMASNVTGITCPAHIRYLSWHFLSTLTRSSLSVNKMRFWGIERLPFRCVYLCTPLSACTRACAYVTSELGSCGGSLQTKFTMPLVEVNVCPPICCFLIIPCYLWKRRVQEYGRSVQQPSFSIYSFALPAISPSFVKSAVAAGGEFAQNVLPGVSISCQKERRRWRQLRRISERRKGNE